MDRRELLGMLGAASIGSVVPHAAAADHGKPAKGAGAGAKGDASGQAMAPVDALHLHFCGIHIAKNNPQFQLVTQHYCAGRSPDMHQCLLYDSEEPNAKLLGVEYIISNELYQGLPEGEKKYWHPHTYEVLAGGLIAPAMPAAEEAAFMKALLTTWGKTWHTWPDPTTDVPIGEPLLMWALTGDGQEDKAVVAARDKLFGVNIDEIRRRRLEQIGYDVPEVSLPASIDTPGRQWTNSGPDKPTKRG